MNLIGPLIYDTLFLNEKCHSKWHSNSNDTHVYILQKKSHGNSDHVTYPEIFFFINKMNMHCLCPKNLRLNVTSFLIDICHLPDSSGFIHFKALIFPH